MNIKHFLLFTFLGLSSSAYSQQTHTVKAQETLFSISKKYTIKVDQLKKWNRLTSNSIAVGQVLLVTDPFLKLQQKPPEPLFENKEISSVQTHVVKKGESLFGISKKYNLPISDIKSINNLKSDELSIGQILTIRLPESRLLLENEQEKVLNLETFKKIEISSSVNLEFILNEYAITQNELQALNLGTDLSKLTNGQFLNIIEPSRKSYQNPYLVSNSSSSRNNPTTVSKTIPTFVYSDSEEGNVTTSGELVNQDFYTIAHPDYAFGTIVTIINKTLNKVVIARVNDRTIENAIKITDKIKRAIGYNPTAQHEILVAKKE